MNVVPLNRVTCEKKYAIRVISNDIHVIEFEEMILDIKSLNPFLEAEPDQSLKEDIISRDGIPYACISTHSDSLDRRKEPRLLLPNNQIVFGNSIILGLSTKRPNKPFYFGLNRKDLIVMSGFISFITDGGLVVDDNFILVKIIDQIRNLINKEYPNEE